jgi:hypothetical protein
MENILFPPNSKLDYNCQFCGKQGHVEFYDPPLIPGKASFDVSKFIPLLCCDRCGLYERKRRDLFSVQLRQAAKLVTIRILAPDEDDNDRKILEEKIRKSLVRLSQRFGNLVAEFWSRAFIWEPDLVESIMRDPSQAARFLGGYVRAIKRL